MKATQLNQQQISVLILNLIFFTFELLFMCYFVAGDYPQIFYIVFCPNK